jgi:hypothetical protein
MGGERDGDFADNFNDFSEYYLISKIIHLIHNENGYVGLVYPFHWMTILVTWHSLVVGLQDFCTCNHLYEYNIPNQIPSPM